MSDATVFGIPNCDTVRKARKWLDAQGAAYHFHDLRKDGIDAARLSRWAAKVGWEALLNRRGTTFRSLPDEARADLDEARALDLMEAHPSLIKRPVVEQDDAVLVGFDEAVWSRRFG